MKAWSVENDEGLMFYNAETRGKAIAAYAEGFGITFGEAIADTIRRHPELDDLPLTLYYALAIGTCTFSEEGCPRCGITFDVTTNGNQVTIVSYDDFNRSLRPILDSDGGLWCSQECLEGVRS